MMKNPAYYLSGSSVGWAVYSLHESGSADQQVEALAAALDEQSVCQLLGEHASAKQHNCVQVVIGLPASWCLCAEVSDAGIPRGSKEQSKQALYYRLEAKLPITAESCVIDLLGSGTEKLGIAIDAARLKSLVHRLEDQGHHVVSITPRAMLAAQSWLAEAPDEWIDQPTTISWVEADAGTAAPIQFMHLAPKHPPRWRMLSLPLADNESSKSLVEQLVIDDVFENASDRRWLVSGDDTAIVGFLAQQGIQPQRLAQATQAEYKSATAVVEKPGDAWVNLCSGPLAPRHYWRRVRFPAGAAIAAAMLLLLTLSAVLLARAEGYSQIADQIDDRSAQAFAKAMPGQPVPTSPQRRLQTRLKQLRGESGIAGGDQLMDTSAPTLTVLYDLLVSLPDQQRFAVIDLRLEGGGVRINGYARSHSEADQLANALRQTGVFTADPPSTDNLPDGGVRFSLEARHLRPEIDTDKVSPAQSPDSSGPRALAERTSQGVNR